MTILDEFVKPWPKAIMRGDIHTTADSHAAGFTAWWILAGVDSPVSEEAVNWLQPAQFGKARAATPASAAGIGNGSAMLPDALPDTLGAFHAYLSNAATLPEAKWPGRRITPAGPAAPSMMIIVDVPDDASDETGAHFGPASRRMVDGMIRAVGLAPEQCYFASLALVRPAGGAIDATTLPHLVDRMRHHIMLATPKAVLLMGDRTNRALGGADSPAASRFLPFINHASGTVPGVATCHPALLLDHPAAKMECWRALQQLMVHIS